MDRLMAEESWGTIVLDVDGGHVSLRQDWYYRWLIRPAPSPLREDIVGHGQWTEYVKEETHRAVPGADSRCLGTAGHTDSERDG